MISHTALRSGLESVFNGASRNKILPVLSHIRLHAAAEGLTMSATDLQAQVTRFIPGEFKGMDICVPADRLKSAVEILTGEIKFKVDDASVTLKGSRGSAKMPYLKGADMPTILDEHDVIATLDMEKIFPAMKVVSFAAAVKDVRYYFCTIHLQSTGKRLTVTATNGHMIAQYFFEIECPKFEVLIPAPSFAKIKACDKLEIRKSTARFVHENTTTVVKLVDGKFPATDRLFPTKLDNSISFNRSQMIDAAHAAGALHEDKQMKVVRIVNPEVNTGVLTVGIDRGNEGGTFEVDGGGDQIDYSYQIGYLCGVLSALKKEQAVLEWEDRENAPACFSEDNFRVVLMPARN